MNNSMGVSVTDRIWRVGEAPGRLPLIGHLVPLLRRPLEFIGTLRECGDLVELRLGGHPAYAVCHPELLREVLRDARSYDKGGRFYDSTRDFLGNGLVVSNWAEHRTQRRMVQPAFHRQRMAGYAALMQEEAVRLCAPWRPGDRIDIMYGTHTVAARITFRSLFSTDATTQIVHEVQQSIIPLGEGVFRRVVDPTGLYQRLPLPGNRRFGRLVTRLYEIVGDLVNARRRSADGDHGDVLSMLLAARDEDTGAGLTDGEVMDQVLNILLGGSETAATTLAWVFHLLSQHPEVERRVHDEVDEVLDGRPAGYADLPRLGYTSRVITETLRLWSPLWLLTRQTTVDTVLAGHRIPAGTTILYSLFGMHRDPEVFDEPERFDPDRWLPERAASLPRHALTPFGAGSRKCIGDDFAMVEMAIVLATVAGRWRLLAQPGATLRPRALGTLSPGHPIMTAEPRRA
jgi:cyclooctatin synthase